MSELIGGKGKVAMVVHDQTSQTGIERRDGFVDWMKANAPDIELCPCSTAAATRPSRPTSPSRSSQANPDLKGIYGANEGSAIGVVKGVEESGKKGITIIGFDSGKAQIDAIKQRRDGRRDHPEPGRHGQGAGAQRDEGDQGRDAAQDRSTPASTGTTRPTSTTRRSRPSSTSTARGVVSARMDALRALRDGLLENREDWETACASFAWPALDEFNWALDWFDPFARGNDAVGLLVVEADGSSRLADLRRAGHALGPARELAARAGRRARRPDRADARQPGRAVGDDAGGDEARRGRDPRDDAAGRADLRDRIDRGSARHVVVRSADAGEVRRRAGRLHADRGRRTPSTAGSTTRSPTRRRRQFAPDGPTPRDATRCSCTSPPARPRGRSSSSTRTRPIRSAISRRCTGSACSPATCT